MNQASDEPAPGLLLMALGERARQLERIAAQPRQLLSGAIRSLTVHDAAALLIRLENVCNEAESIAGRLTDLAGEDDRHRTDKAA